ncbi:MAG: NAD(P)/FAD-dependent oxidoreductase [Alphaproteobacteria bacterium]|nr:NAD(P)/FAD-dependent oxidoreductase [Alphaproteobacteria bacterium]
MEHVDAVVVGAGVVGLAVTRALAMAGIETIAVEAADMIGTGTSSRNSEVIHAGIYYPTGSLKALTCVAGKAMLYAYAEEKGVPYRRCGKLIVATSEAQDRTLEQIKAKAAANGVDDLVWLTSDEVRALEPEVVCTAALLSPSTGIIDSHGLMLAYQGDAEDHGAFLAFNAPLLQGRATDRGFELEIGGDEPMTLGTGMLINAGGLFAPEIAGKINGLDPAFVPKARFAKGNYYILVGARPFSHLVYPVPEDGGLGVHVTLDLGGQVKFGPDVEWLPDVERVDQLTYDVDPRRADVFYEAVRSYYPGLEDGAIEPGYAGIRPKLSAKGEPAADFVLQGPAEHGVPGLVNLFGIESPGLTASMALADLVVERLAPGKRRAA